MQPQARKQVRPVQQRRWIEPTQPQSHVTAPMHAQGHGMISKFIPTCHFCGIDGHIRPNCFHYIELCRVKSMIEKRMTRARMHVNRKKKFHVHDPMTSKTLEPLTTRKKKVISMWIRKIEPACYKTNKSQIGSTKSNGLGRSIGPHNLH